jgi:hypothetical protein
MCDFCIKGAIWIKILGVFLASSTEIQEWNVITTSFKSMKVGLNERYEAVAAFIREKKD